MAQDNLRALRAVYERWAEGDFQSGASLLDPEIVFVVGPGFPDGGIYHGAAGVREYMRPFLSAWTDLTITPEEFIEADGSILVAVHQRGIGRESGVPAELHYFHVWTFRGSTVIRLDNIRDRSEAFAAVGLPD